MKSTPLVQIPFILDSNDGKKTVLYRPIYDENTKIIRVVANDRIFEPYFDEQGQYRRRLLGDLSVRNLNHPQKTMQALVANEENSP